MPFFRCQNWSTNRPFPQFCSKNTVLPPFRKYVFKSLRKNTSSIGGFTREFWLPFTHNLFVWSDLWRQRLFLLQVCEAYVAGFDFAVLNNAYVIHDGFKTTSTQSKDQENAENARLFNNVIRPELRFKYPESKRICWQDFKQDELPKEVIHFFRSDNTFKGLNL